MGRRILVPLDGSSGSETALEYVAGLARAEGATLRLVHVAPRPEAMLALDGGVIAYADQVAAGVADEARGYLSTAAARAPGVTVETVVCFGDPAAEILAEAGREGVALIAMATHRRRGLRRLVEGSVAERVERQSPVPVLLLEYGEARPTERIEDSLARDGRHVTRRFWCVLSRRDVEVEFVERGLPGLPSAVTVRACSAFDPPTAIECRRRCVEPAYRRQWEPALPLYDRAAGDR